MRLRHTLVVATPDSGDGKVSSNAWNSDHALTGTPSMLVGFDGNGNATEIDPNTVGAANNLSSWQWVLNFTDNGTVYIPANVAMTVDNGIFPIGSGTLAFKKSTASDPGTFTDTSLPTDLEAGSWLSATLTSIVGFYAAQLVRIA